MLLAEVGGSPYGRRRMSATKMDVNSESWMALKAKHATQRPGWRVLKESAFKARRVRVTDRS
jgi:hypothetical protein